MSQILLYCRPGFERECAQEIADRAAAHGVEGEASAESDSGFVGFSSGQAVQLDRRLPFDSLIFARQWLHGAELVDDLPANDRLAPLLDHCAARGKFGEVFVEHADTNQAKGLSPFCRRFSAVFAAAAEKAGLLDLRRGRTLPRLHLFFFDATRCYV